MIRNYLKTTLRNLFRDANYTVINVLGLSIGLTAAIVIYLLIRYELDFDKFHKNADRIYRVVQRAADGQSESPSSTVPYPMIEAFHTDIPEVPLATEIHYEDDVVITVGVDKIRIPSVVYADSMFFDVFDFKVISGNPKKDMAQPNRVYLTKSLADKLLKGNETLRFKIDNSVEVEVAGIVADPPSTSHLSFEMVVSYPSMTKETLNGFDRNSWNMTMSGYLYFVLPESMTPDHVSNILNGFPKKYRPKDETPVQYLLQPLSEIHFSKEYDENPGPARNSDVGSLIVLGVLGWFILAIACINFVNLATALAIRKSREIGIRKTLGAKRSSLTTYFLLETFVIILFSILISLGAAEWLLKWLNNFLSVSLSLNLFSDMRFLSFVIVLALLATLLSGFYPAVILSGFDPVSVLKNKVSARGSSGSLVRKVLVVFQFTIAQALIIGTLIVADQMDYFMSKPLGFEKEALINVSLPGSERELVESFRERLMQVQGVEQVSFSVGGPTSDNNFNTDTFLSEQGPSAAFNVAVKPIDINYQPVYGIKMKAGRWFTEAESKAATDPSLETKSYVYIVNEAYVRRIGLASAEEMIGKRITTGINRINAEVIGVVEDFHMGSLHDQIQPMVMIIFPFFYYDAGVKIQTKDPSAVVKGVKEAYEHVYPEYDFQYTFLDEYLKGLYRQDDRTFTLFKIFSGVSIFIGCLGLYGLISFMANQKLREVGIRKVLGATTASIVQLFGMEFVRLVVIAFFIAAPLTYFAMEEWLNGFAYRAQVSWLNFFAGVGATMAIALATVSYRAIRSALANPVDVLRTE